MRQSDRFCLDAFAWLAWLQDEAGAVAVQRCLDDAELGRADCVTSIINLGEAFYRLVRVNRREQAESSKLEAVMKEDLERALKDGFPADEIAGAKKGWTKPRRVSRSQDP